MTCVIAFVHDGKVYMGQDSASVNGWETRQLDKPGKVFKIYSSSGTMMFGVAGWARVGQVLHYHLHQFLNMTSAREYDANHERLVFDCVIPGMKECLKRNNLIQTDEGVEVMPDTDILFGFKGSIFHIGRSFFVERYAEPFTAIGVGSQYALGAMEAFMLRDDFDPKFIVHQALRIAGRFCNGVCDPYYVECLDA